MTEEEQQIMDDLIERGYLTPNPYQEMLIARMRPSPLAPLSCALDHMRDEVQALLEGCTGDDLLNARRAALDALESADAGMRDAQAVMELQEVIDYLVLEACHERMP